MRMPIKTNLTWTSRDVVGGDDKGEEVTVKRARVKYTICVMPPPQCIDDCGYANK